MLLWISLYGRRLRLIRRKCDIISSTSPSFIVVTRRILFVTDSLFPAGNAQSLHLLSSQLVEDGLEVHVATKCNDPFAGSLADGVVVHPDITHSKRATNEFQAAIGLRKLIKRIAPDIVHSWCGYSNHVSGLGLTMAGVHGRNVRFYSTELFQQPQATFVTGMARRRINRRPEKFIVPHESLGRSLKGQGIREHRIAVVPNGISPTSKNRSSARSLLRETFGLPENARVAVAVAPLIPRTRIKDLIWALDLLVVIRDDIHLLVIGEGPHKWQLRHYVGFTEAENHIHFTGNHPDSLDFITGADFYWHSHLLNPLPVPVLYAMSAGVPVISVFGAGTTELVVSQQTGLAVNFGARDEFARWTKYLIEQPHSAEQLSLQGMEHVRENFAPAQMINGYKEIYAQI